MRANMDYVASTHNAKYELKHGLYDVKIHEFEDESIDAVFLYGLHTEEGLNSDLYNILPKVRSGGFLIFNGYGNPSFPGVTKAVNDFARSLPGGKAQNLRFRIGKG